MRIPGHDWPGKGQFWPGIFKSVGDGKDSIESSYSSIVREIIWLNNDITFKGKSLLYKNWIKSDILFIGDIVKGNGFLEIDDLKC